tara:strand:+ start:15201 stop:16163 length:963 start_codon:yes stop_codon:yes gene_type:complete
MIFKNRKAVKIDDFFDFLSLLKKEKNIILFLSIVTILVFVFYNFFINIRNETFSISLSMSELIKQANLDEELIINFDKKTNAITKKNKLDYYITSNETEDLYKLFIDLPVYFSKQKNIKIKFDKDQYIINFFSDKFDNFSLFQKKMNSLLGSYFQNYMENKLRLIDFNNDLLILKFNNFIDIYLNYLQTFENIDFNLIDNAFITVNDGIDNNEIETNLAKLKNINKSLSVFENYYMSEIYNVYFNLETTLLVMKENNFLKNHFKNFNNQELVLKNSIISERYNIFEIIIYLISFILISLFISITFIFIRNEYYLKRENNG